MGWYSDNSKIEENYVDEYQKIENMDFSAGDWEQYAKAVLSITLEISTNMRARKMYQRIPFLSS